MKRKFYRQPRTEEPIVDMRYLVNKKQLITQNEFKNILPLSSYEEYKHEFFHKNISECFDKFNKTSWFKERYFRKNSEIKNKTNQRFQLFLEKLKVLGVPSLDENIQFRYFDCSVKNIIIKNVPDEMTNEELNDIAKKCPNYENFTIFQFSSKRSFKRLGCIILNKDADCEQSIQFLRSMIYTDKTLAFEVLNLSEVYIRKINVFKEPSDLKNAKELLKYFCDENNDLLDFVKTSEYSESLDFYILLLRNVFFYCFYCCKKFDSEIEMINFCGDHHVRSNEGGDRKLFNRKQELIKMMNSIPKLNNKTENEELAKLVVKNDENEYKCYCCVKMFENMEFVLNHLRNKHAEDVQIVRNGVEDYNAFINEIDFFLYSYITGLEYNFIPDIVEKYGSTRTVIYDFDEVFSGEIILNK